MLGLTQQLCRLQNFSPADSKHLQAFALLHDIGHGPFSHQIEPVLASDHHQVGQQRLLEIAPALERCGLSLAELQAMLAGTHPLSPWISRP